MTATILLGDASSVLAALPERSFQTCVTSPPYFGLRNYGAEGQIGLENSPDEFVERLVEVFRGVRRVLRDDGTLWLNMGDSYCGNGGAGGVMASTGLGSTARSGLPRPEALDGRMARWRRDYGDAKPKDLLMIPAMLALALRRDGWFLRSDIIWSKPNPMPESVTDRPTSAHEHLFLLSKSERYFYDGEAIKEDASVPGSEDGTRVFGGVNKAGANLQHGHRTSGRLAGVPAPRKSVPRGGFGGKTAEFDGREAFRAVVDRRNARSVWTISTQPCGDQLCQPCGRYFTGAEWNRLPRKATSEGARGAAVCRCARRGRLSVRAARWLAGALRDHAAAAGGARHPGRHQRAWRVRWLRRSVAARPGKAAPAGWQAAGWLVGQARRRAAPRGDRCRALAGRDARGDGGLGANLRMRAARWIGRCAAAGDRSIRRSGHDGAGCAAATASGHAHRVERWVRASGAGAGGGGQPIAGGGVMKGETLVAARAIEGAAAVADLPASVRVGGVDVAVIAWSMHSAGASRRWGEWSAMELVIRIQEQMPSAARAVEAVLHEVLHAIWWAYSIPGQGIEEEAAVSQLAAAWATLWRDNPALLSWVTRWSGHGLEADF
jgi:hypothetical protein